MTPSLELNFRGTAAPLVSIIVTNWNYARYIGDAIDSIKGQSYENFQCIVVDNGSTDGSREVIEERIAQDPRFTAEFLPQNFGQNGGFHAGLAHVRGILLCTVDADDIIFPGFLAHHVQAHLAFPRSVGITSSNIVEIDSDGSVMTGSYGHFRQREFQDEKLAQDGKPVVQNERPARLRLRNIAYRIPEISDDEYERLRDSTSYVPSYDYEWRWSPGTANMWRTSLVRMTKLEKPGTVHHGSIDNQLHIFCHLMTGSALIDIPLSAYRTHGRNIFSRMESLRDTLHGNIGYLDDEALKYRVPRLVHLIENAKNFDSVSCGRFWHLFDGTARVGSIHQAKSLLETAEIENAFVKALPELMAFFGEWRTISEIMDRLGFSRTRTVIRKATAGSKKRVLLLKLADLYCTKMVKLARSLRSK